MEGWATWKGTGRHGEGQGGEWRHVTSAEREILVDDHGVSDEEVEQHPEPVGDAVDDQGVEGMRLEDPPPHQRR